MADAYHTESRRFEHTLADIGLAGIAAQAQDRVTDKAAGKKGISAFIVPTATPGYTVARIEDKMGQHASDTAQILFENCRVPAANRLGEEGMGLRIALSGLEGGRIGIASQSVGMARAASKRRAS